jgi:hypothetical protein
MCERGRDKRWAASFPSWQDPLVTHPLEVPSWISSPLRSHDRRHDCLSAYLHGQWPCKEPWDLLSGLGVNFTVFGDLLPGLALVVGRGWGCVEGCVSGRSGGVLGHGEAWPRASETGRIQLMAGGF